MMSGKVPCFLSAKKVSDDLTNISGWPMSSILSLPIDYMSSHKVICQTEMLEHHLHVMV